MNDVKYAPVKMFGKTRSLPLVIVVNCQPVEGEEYDDEIWIERGEDYYGLSSPELKNKRVRIVKREDWVAAELTEIKK